MAIKTGALPQSRLKDCVKQDDYSKYSQELWMLNNDIIEKKNGRKQKLHLFNSIQSINSSIVFLQ